MLESDLEDVSAFEIESWLQTLGIQQLIEWDVLVYLYRHQSSLINAEQISHLLNYGSNLIVEALKTLESLGLVERSRASRGARLHRLVPPVEPPCQEAFERLIGLKNAHPVRRLLARRRYRGNVEHE
ncbi:hypothetical protein C7Y66_29635 [Chroococcidiopsis sp. CCALA 051]|uniref:MarR family transcriptional regulator n=1 Tax=Chroococcidiopsis sp. CCALA 051 TaxID=869949 RepID=UPI000D0D9D62|nr:MarR family transcriptional regulator [Chroococcidiopsis sp. CCALA 051]PSM45573.1 hypothetical protein C7Y66_29635 [Chroococcidiopsis sp. CCALA 051]